MGPWNRKWPFFTDFGRNSRKIPINCLGPAEVVKDPLFGSNCDYIGPLNNPALLQADYRLFGVSREQK